MEPLPLPEPLATDLQTYLGDLDALQGLQQAQAAAQTAADQAAAALAQAQQATAQGQQAVQASRAQVNADLDALQNPPMARRGRPGQPHGQQTPKGPPPPSPSQGKK